MAVRRKKRAPVMRQPTTVLGAGVSVGSIGTFLPPSWQPWFYGVSAILGVVAPMIASHMQNQQRASD